MAQAQAEGEAAGFVRAFLGIGLMSFGGPAGQIATMHRELVDRRGWLTEAQFLAALNFCMLLPGPEAQQLATWCGWRLRGTRGGLAAGLLFVAPGAIVMASLVAVYISFGRVPLVQAVFGGVRAVVVAVVAQAVVRLARRALKTPGDWAIAGLALSAASLFAVPFPLIVGAALLIRWARGGPAPAAIAASASGPVLAPILRTALPWLAVWLSPLLLLWAVGLADFAALGGFFARLAAVSFGGAYAGLAWVAQTAAAGHGWVTPAEMVDGLALAETTPGPLVLVYQFVGGVAGGRLGGGLAGAALGMALVLWVTFAPSFLLVLALAPQLERLTSWPPLAGALAGVTAAVVGVMASLALWFALHVLFAGVATVAVGPLRLWQPIGPPDAFAIVLALVAALMLQRPRAGLGGALAVGAAAGLIRFYLNAG